MINEICLVGRLVDVPKFGPEYNNMLYIPIQLRITRVFKDMNGEYTSDILTIDVRRGDAIHIMDCCQVDDVVGIKGRIELQEDGMHLVAEKVSFI